MALAHTSLYTLSQRVVGLPALNIWAPTQMVNMKKLILLTLCLFAFSAHAQRGTGLACDGMVNCNGRTNNHQQPQTNQQRPNNDMGRALEVIQGIQRANAENEQRRRAQQYEALDREVEAIEEHRRRADQAGAAAAASHRNDPSLNPFGPRYAGAQMASESPSQQRQNPGSGTLDTSKNLEGTACTWMVVKDEETCSSRSCTYSDGQTVAVGSSAYVCTSGRWSRLRDCTQSPTEQQKKECVRDIIRIHGAPGSKEGRGVQVFAPN